MNIIEWAATAKGKVDMASLTEGDSLVLCQLAYFRWTGYEGLPLSEIFARVQDDCSHIIGAFHVDEYQRLLAAVACERFGDVVVLGYRELFDEETSCQYSSVLFDLGDALYYALRGTDGTLVGWKEDLDLLYSSNLPSQTLAKEDINAYAARYPDKPIVVGGHSKGGNLAEFSAIFCEPSVERRIVKVFNHDGPGFREGLVENNPQRLRLVKRTAKTVPEFSVFGLMLNREPYEIVKADVKGIWQHYAFHWCIKPNGSFERTYRLEDKAILICNIIETMLPTMPQGERMMFVHTLYQALRAADVERVGDIKTAHTLFRIIRFNRSLPRNTKNTLWKMFFRLLSVIAKESASGEHRQSKTPKVHRTRSLKLRAAKLRGMMLMHQVHRDEQGKRMSLESRVKSVKRVKKSSVKLDSVKTGSR